jgi:hypothetical protein
MEKRILDASGGVLTELHVDDEQIVINRRASMADLKGHAEATKSLRDDRVGQTAGSSRKHDMYMTSSVPSIVIEQWMIKYGVNVMALNKDDYNNFVKDRLNEPDYIWLRTAPDRFYKRKRGWKFFIGGVSKIAPTAGDIARQK